VGNPSVSPFLAARTCQYNPLKLNVNDNFMPFWSRWHYRCDDYPYMYRLHQEAGGGQIFKVNAKTKAKLRGFWESRHEIVCAFHESTQQKGDA